MRRMPSALCVPTRPADAFDWPRIGPDHRAPLAAPPLLSLSPEPEWSISRMAAGTVRASERGGLVRRSLGHAAAVVAGLAGALEPVRGWTHMPTRSRSLYRGEEKKGSLFPFFFASLFRGSSFCSSPVSGFWSACRVVAQRPVVRAGVVASVVPPLFFLSESPKDGACLPALFTHAQRRPFFSGRACLAVSWGGGSLHDQSVATGPQRSRSAAFFSRPPDREQCGRSRRREDGHAQPQRTIAARDARPL